MKKSSLKSKKWVYLDTVDAYEKFLNDLDDDWETKAGARQNTFPDWVDHYYNHLLKELGPSNGWLFS